MATVNAVLTTTYNAIIADRATELLAGKTIAGAFLTNAVSDMGSRYGNTITYHRAPKGTVQNAADLTTKTYANTAGSTDDLVLEYYKEVPFEAGDLDYNVGNPNVAVNYYAESAAKQLRTQVDTDILERIFDDPNIAGLTEIGTSGTALNDAALRQIRTNLIKNGVDIDDVMVFLTPDHSGDFMGLDTTRDNDLNTKGIVINGQYPRKIYGMDVYLDCVNLPTLTAADSISGSSTTQYLSFACSKNAVKTLMMDLNIPAQNNAMINKSTVDGITLRSKMWYDPLRNATQLSVDALYGAKVLKEATTQSATDVTNIMVIRGGAS